MVPGVLKDAVRDGFLRSGQVNLDYGGGLYDKTTQWLKTKGIRNLVFDPFNRLPEQNEAVLREVIDKGELDTVTLLNVLNVIPDFWERMVALAAAWHFVPPYGLLIVGTYVGDGSGVTRKSRFGYQLNQHLDFYESEVIDLLGLGPVKSNGYLVFRKPRK